MKIIVYSKNASKGDLTFWEVMAKLVDGEIVEELSEAEVVLMLQTAPEEVREVRDEIGSDRVIIAVLTTEQIVGPEVCPDYFYRAGATFTISDAVSRAGTNLRSLLQSIRANSDTTTD